MPSPIFSAATFPPHARDDDEFQERYEKILQVSRERYCKKREVVQEKINSMMKELEDAEEQWEQKKIDFKKKKDEDKRAKK